MDPGVKCATVWFVSLRTSPTLLITDAGNLHPWIFPNYFTDIAGKIRLSIRDREEEETYRRRTEWVQMRREWQCEEMKVFPFERGWSGLVWMDIFVTRHCAYSCMLEKFSSVEFSQQQEKHYKPPSWQSSVIFLEIFFQVTLLLLLELFVASPCFLQVITHIQLSYFTYCISLLLWSNYGTSWFRYT